MKHRFLSSLPHSAQPRPALLPAVPKRFGVALVKSGLVALLLCIAVNAAAQSRSDLLIVLDTDGTGYTAQQTLFADDELVVTRLPPERTTIETVFSGSGSALYRRAHENEPNKLTLVSGSVFTRFRHRFDSEEDIPDADADAPQLRQASLTQFETTMASAQSLLYSVSWLLPSNLELVSFYPDESDAADSSISWTQNGPMLTFRQSGGVPADLRIEYRVNPGSASAADDCLSTIGPSEWCSPDTDRDLVPDYRDLCLATEPDGPASDEQPNVLADNTGGSRVARPTPSTVQADSLGCGDDVRIVLADAQFESGQTYLNVKARTLLDKVAIALQRQPDKLYRIAAFTDNAGYFENNQLLSKDRADAIRHYLILRGVSPNQVQARGYGESNPAHDNRTAAGRRANRRVELQRLN